MTICVEWAGDHITLALMIISPLYTKICLKTIFTLSYTVTFNFDL